MVTQLVHATVAISVDVSQYQTGLSQWKPAPIPLVCMHAEPTFHPTVKRLDVKLMDFVPMQQQLVLHRLLARCQKAQQLQQ